jgi:phosphoglycerate dehydrogenase-like enzyme
MTQSFNPTMDKINLLVNLPPGFYKTPSLKPIFQRMGTFANVRKKSHNAPQEIEKDLAWADYVLMWSWPKLLPELLDKAPKLKMVGHLDVSQSAAKVAIERNLPLSVSRAGFSPAVAEMALTLILTTLRKTSNYHAQMRTAKEPWVASFPDDIDPLERELTGRSVGIIGFGRIGRRLGELLQPFKCDLRVADPFVPDAAVQQLGGRKAELSGLLKNSDIVVLCAASNQGTKHLLGRKQINGLRKNGILINVARAALVDTDALVARLKKNDLFAAIDVFDQEPLPKNHPLRKLPNAYLTPHRAGGLMASVERILNWLVDDIQAHIDGKERKHALTEAMIPALDA